MLGIEQHDIGHELGVARGRTGIFRLVYKEGAWYVLLLAGLSIEEGLRLVLAATIVHTERSSVAKAPEEDDEDTVRSPTPKRGHGGVPGDPVLNGGPPWAGPSC